MSAIWITSIETKRLYDTGQVPPAKKKIKNDKGEYEWIEVPPQTLLSEMGMYCALAGVLGARLFHILEYPDQFLADPVGMIFSRGGLTIYGGLILGTAVGFWFGFKHKFKVMPMADACAYGMMLAYAVGRIGCQIAGDGDWGIAADLGLKPDWLPTWFWAQTYTGNVLGKEILIPGVYPTPLYETLACLLCFGIMWALRRHPFQYGWMFAFYMVLTGIQRFWIEKIRVNIEFEYFGIRATQAEIVSVIIFWIGLVGLIFLTKKREGGQVEPSQS